MRRDTIWTWRQQPSFQARLAELERDFDCEMYYQRRALLGKALTSLEQLVRSPRPRTSLVAMEPVLRVDGRFP